MQDKTPASFPAAQIPFHYFVECENAIVQQTMIALGKPHKRKLKNANLELKALMYLYFQTKQVFI